MAMQNSLPVMDAMKMAWEKSKGAKGTIWACLGIIFLVQFVFSFVSGFIEGMVGETSITGMLLRSVIAIIGMTIVFLLTASVLYICIRRVKGETISYNMMKHVFTWRFFINLLIFQILINFVLVWGLIMLVTLIFGFNFLSVAILVIMLLFLMARLGFGVAFIVDQDIDAIKAIKRSYQVTAGNVFNLLGFFILGFIIMFLSAIPLGIGLIWSLPWLHLAYGEVYKRLALDP